MRKLLKTNAGNEYRLFMTDYLDGSGFFELDANPVVRLWKSGVVKATVRFESAAVDPACIPAGGATPCDWWNVGSLTGSGVFSTINALGDATAPALSARAAPRPGCGSGPGMRSGITRASSGGSAPSGATSAGTQR